MKTNKKKGVFIDRVPVIFAIRFFQATEKKGNTKPPQVTMRQTRTDQVSIFGRFSNYDIGSELKAISERLDRHRELLEWVALDLPRKDVYDTGRQGLSAESVVRCAMLKQYQQLSYQATISRIQPATWEKINRVLLRDAKGAKVIETINAGLDHVRLDREHPYDLSGFAARLAAKMVRHNLCMWLNQQLGWPRLAFVDLNDW